jgi:hypothetical protein
VASKYGFNSDILPYAVNWKQVRRDYQSCYLKKEEKDCEDDFINQCCDREWWCVTDYLFDYIDCRLYGTQSNGDPLLTYCCPAYSFHQLGFHQTYKPVAINLKEKQRFDYKACYRHPKIGAPCDKEGYTSQCCDKYWWCVSMEYHPWARELGWTNCSWYGTQIDGTALHDFCCPPLSPPATTEEQDEWSSLESEPPGPDAYRPGSDQEWNESAVEEEEASGSEAYAEGSDNEEADADSGSGDVEGADAEELTDTEHVFEKHASAAEDADATEEYVFQKRIDEHPIERVASSLFATTKIPGGGSMKRRFMDYQLLETAGNDELQDIYVQDGVCPYVSFGCMRSVNAHFPKEWFAVPPLFASCFLLSLVVSPALGGHVVWRRRLTVLAMQQPLLG